MDKAPFDRNNYRAAGVNGRPPMAQRSLEEAAARERDDGQREMLELAHQGDRD